MKPNECLFLQSMFRQLKLLGWSLVFLIASILTLCFYFQEGMFFDGITYSALGRNLYLGYGSFWRPYYNEFFSPFYNHPPLVYWFLSKFYMLFGDNMYVPKIYNLIVLLFTILVMRSIWIKMDERNRTVDWWPFILWFCSSIVFNTYRNTMLECTLSLFTLVSILLLFRVVTDQKKIWLLLCLSSIFVFLAFLTKGFVGLFPLCFTVLYGFLYKLSFRKMLIYSVILFAGFGLCYYLIITRQDASKPYFDYYYNQHVFRAISGNEAVSFMGRYFLMLQLLLELSPWIGLSVIFILFSKRLSLKINYKLVFLFMLVGISASFPLFISPKQRTYYLLPGIPYFILAFALITQPLIIHLIGKLKPRKIYNVLPIVFMVAGIVYCIIFAQQKEPDADLISDCRKLDNYLPDKTVLATNTELANNWKIMAYLARIGTITPSDNLESEFILVPKGDFPVSNSCERQDLELKLFDLYKKP